VAALDRAAVDPQDLGAVESDGSTHHLRFERFLAHSIEDVWAAVSEPDRLARWLAAAALEPRVGGTVELRWLNTEDGGEPVTARGTVTAWQPPHVVEYDTDVHGRLRFELSPVEDGTRLVFTVDITMPPEHLLKNVAGWHVHLEHLEDVLAGATIDWAHWYAVHFPRWQTIHDAYAARR